MTPAAEHQTRRTHSICTNTSSLLLGHFSFLQDWMWRRAHGQWENTHLKPGNRFCDDRETPQVICATLWIALFFPPSLPFSSFLLSCVSLFIVRPMKSINYPSLQSYWKGLRKKQREMRAANPFFIPLVALNKRRMCCLSLTEGIKSSRDCPTRSMRRAEHHWDRQSEEEGSSSSSSSSEHPAWSGHFTSFNNLSVSTQHQFKAN